jgi:DNA-binding beta-propeller fold protein YncE
VSPGAVRLCWLQSVCAVAEGADVPLPQTSPTMSSCCPAGVCVAAVLGDALRRVAVLGGREGMPRSLGSVYGGSVTRFLGGGLVLDVSRTITTGVRGSSGGMAVSRDGSTLLLPVGMAFHVFRVADGSRLRVVGREGRRPLQFSSPCQVCVDADGFVFVAEYGNARVQVLTPALDFHCFVGVGSLYHPIGVCANAAVVVVSEFFGASRISVFDRRDGSLLRRFGSVRGGDGQFRWPRGLCFIDDDRHIAIADYGCHRVSVFSVDGQFIRHVGVGVLDRPHAVACTAFDELVVADSGNSRVAVFSASGNVIATSPVDGGRGSARQHRVRAAC